MAIREQILDMIDQGMSLGEISRKVGISTGEVVDCYNGKPISGVTQKKLEKSDYGIMLNLCTKIHHAEPPADLPQGAKVRRYCKNPCQWSRGKAACTMPGGCWRKVGKFNGK